MKQFMDQDFILESETAKRLYHDYAKEMPIFDYHCHLPPEHIAQNKSFDNLSQIWLNGDHYKWRAMRSNGVKENFCTGDASDREKFQAWAETVPHTIGNPLYHWTHMELKDPFGITGKVLNPETAESIWQETKEKLSQESFSVYGLLSHFKVKAICTTDDPADNLEHHKAIADGTCPAKVLPTFRPDKAMAIDTGNAYTDYLKSLSKVADTDITSFKSLLDALEKRVDYFHSAGCRLSDHAMTLPFYSAASDAELESTFQKCMKGKEVTPSETEAYRTAVLVFLGRLYAKLGWTMQIHIGALRNNNSRLFKALGPDTGFDSIADGEVAAPLSRLLDSLDVTGELPRTILYVLNPRDNYLVGTMIGNFQDGSIPGKIQFGSGWWFNDQRDGMVDQMRSLANLGLLSRFVGMLTDSRSFLSYPRHDYFRRILCNLIGGWVENGEAPADMNLLGTMVKNISFTNAENYFGIKL